MALLKIYLYGSPVLSRKVKAVDVLPQKFNGFLEDMFETMYDDDGIGLSANQVGLDMKFFIVDVSHHYKDRGREVYINPEILESEGESTVEEGCLSIPGVREKITRAEKIKLRYENLDREVKEEEFTGLYARVIQHEVDHLNGRYIVDRITPLKRSFVSSKLKKIAAIAKRDGSTELRL